MHSHGTLSILDDFIWAPGVAVVSVFGVELNGNAHIYMNLRSNTHNGMLPAISNLPAFELCFSKLDIEDFSKLPLLAGIFGGVRLHRTSRRRRQFTEGISQKIELNWVEQRAMMMTRNLGYRARPGIGRIGS